jgi:hypothetical protein
MFCSQLYATIAATPRLGARPEMDSKMTVAVVAFSAGRYLSTALFEGVQGGAKSPEGEKSSSRHTSPPPRVARAVFRPISLQPHKMGSCAIRFQRA